MTEIIPSPIHNATHLSARRSKQCGVYAQPCCKSDWTRELMAVFANFGYSRITANHSHDPLIKIFDRFGGSALNLADDVLGTKTSSLLRNRRELWERFSVFVHEVGKIPQGVHARHAF